DDRHKEDPAADDIRDNNRRGINRAEPSIEHGRGGRWDGWQVNVARHERRYCASSWRAIGTRCSTIHCDALCFAKICTSISWKWLFFSISARVCGGSPVYPHWVRTMTGFVSLPSNGTLWT